MDICVVCSGSHLPERNLHSSSNRHSCQLPVQCQLLVLVDATWPGIQFHLPPQQWNAWDWASGSPLVIVSVLCHYHRGPWYFDESVFHCCPHFLRKKNLFSTAEPLKKKKYSSSLTYLFIKHFFVQVNVMSAAIIAKREFMMSAYVYAWITFFYCIFLWNGWKAEWGEQRKKGDTGHTVGGGGNNSNNPLPRYSITQLTIEG